MKPFLKNDLLIAFTGPESTGKSTISKALAASFNAAWAPEYAREYLTGKNGKYDQSDLDVIALHQNALIQKAARTGLAMLDTEILVLKIWSEYKYGNCSAMIQTLWEKQQIHHYFLCDIDLPWEEDPLREHPSFASRKEILERYHEALAQKGAAYSVLSGDLPNRISTASEILLQQFSVIQ